ncbi:MAG TPA: penicillin acylase family protein [Paracoccaceae bacterium]|nr:penicillin acylase family protein [Paracoccaceae bacterium]
MHGVLKWLLRLFVAMLALLAIAAMLGWYLVGRSLPDWSGEVAVAGLDAPVRIIRDANAVPHIRAETDHDAFFALGLVHAQDRLWQMELNRRAAQGRLSALLGPRTVEVDRLVKTLDLYGLAQRSFDAQSPETQAALEAYSEGVNAWLRHVNREALGRGAPEFFVFDAGISPWTPADSLAILKMMALRLTDAARDEVRRARALLVLPPERVADILPDYPLPAHITPPRPEAANPVLQGRAALTPLAPLPHDPLLQALGVGARPDLAGASNVWAVDGSRSATGKSLMANDPHLWLSAPSLWYLADVQGGEVAAIGGTLPGVPAVLIGRNRQLGWGLTTATIDDQDLYIEEVNPENPDEYRLPDGTWAEFGERAYRIEIAGALPETGVVRATRHGPVLTGDRLGAATITPPGHVAALAWTALAEDDTSMTAVFELMFATTIEEGVAATSKAVAPAQNVVLADADSVAMVVAGAIPERRPDSRSLGRLPSSGAVAANDWLGVRPADENPRVIRPASGAVANANNRTTDAPFPDHLGFGWAPPYRIERLRKELTAQAFHSRDGFVALQNDAVSEMARSILPLIARDLWWREGMPRIEDERRRRALELLAAWNGEMDRHGPEPLIFSEWVRALTRRLALDELGPLFPDFEGERPLFIERVFRDVDGAGIWCDVNKTPERETCTQMASLALDDALANLARAWGENIEGWRWGEAHVAVHRHTPFGFLGPLGLIFNIENETSGGNETLLRGQTTGRGETPFRNVHAAGLRVVYDFADLDRSLMIISTGQSGHPFSRFYDHLAGLWARGDMIPMSMDDADAMAGALGVMTLTPRQQG